MKWPEQLVYIRHAESDYNATKAVKKLDPEYEKFIEMYDTNIYSREFLALTKKLIKRYSPTHADFNTPLSDRAYHQAYETGLYLPEYIRRPDVVYVSPYDRTKQTFEIICEGWSDLRNAKVIEDERLREQEHGDLILYSDWRFYNVMHPEQRKLWELNGAYRYRYPNGESMMDTRTRSREMLGKFIRDHSNEKVMCISHHLTILSQRANLENWSAEEFVRVNEDEALRPVNCGVTIYEGDPKAGVDGKLILKDYNLKLYKDAA